MYHPAYPLQQGTKTSHSCKSTTFNDRKVTQLLSQRPVSLLCVSCSRVASLHVAKVLALLLPCFSRAIFFLDLKPLPVIFFHSLMKQ